MPESALFLDFYLADATLTGAQALEAAASRTYLVIPFPDGRFAVVRSAELRQKLVAWRMLDMPLVGVPPVVFDAHLVKTVQQDSLDPADAQRVEQLENGEVLVVLAGKRVAGLLVGGARLRGGIRPPLEGVGIDPRGPSDLSARIPGVLSGAEEAKAEEEPEKRFINADMKDREDRPYDPNSRPLQKGEVYTLGFEVDVVARGDASSGFGYRFAPDEQLVTITVRLETDDFEVFDEREKKLLVPPTGKSKNKATFLIEPKHAGECLINAVFLKEGNFIQVMTLRYLVGPLFTSQTLGRGVEAAAVVQPRDLSLVITESVGGFQVIMTGAVGAIAHLPLTLPYLDRMISDLRQELLGIVHLEADGVVVYQQAIDIPAQASDFTQRKLARAGYDLYEKIFYGPGMDAQANLLGDRLREMARQNSLKIQIFSQQFMLPWGLLYVGEDPDRPEAEMFLGLKHIIEHIPLQPGMQVLDQTIDTCKGLEVSLNVNPDIDTEMRAPLVASQLQFWEGLKEASNVRLAVRRTGDEVYQALKDETTPDQVLYFYCHALSKSLAEKGGPDDSVLVFANGQKLTLEDLRRFQRKSLPGAPLVFINACESAELSPLFYDGFVPTFMAKGARGVIGTECEVPAIFAREWANRFFEHFLNGETLGRIFLDLRQEFFTQHHNILGLMYALYVDGDTRVACD